ncbi:hypothetical protein BJX70DRAFT_410393 [Aspergillus crustosus]
MNGRGSQSKLGWTLFGIQALKTRLQKLLIPNVRREFPSVWNKVSSKLKAAKNAMRALSAEREELGQQQRYLLDILIFTEDMAAYGHVHEFDTEKHYTELQDKDELANNISDLFTENRIEKHNIQTRKPTTCPELEDVIPEQIAVTDPVKGEIEPQIKGLYLSSRGFEIRTFSLTLLPVIIIIQSSKWPAIAHGYIANMIIMVHKFVLQALELALIMDDLLAKYSRVIKQVDFLLRIEQTILVQTLTWTFYRQEEQKYSSLEDAITLCKDRAVKVQAKGPSKVQSSGSDVDRVVLELHNTLKSYYAAADFFLVIGEESPMSLFLLSFVSSLTDEQLEEITGEDAGLKRRRAQLKKGIQELEMGRKILV